MRQLTLFIVLALFSLCATAQLGSKFQSKNIYGVWHNDQLGYQMTLMLNADGRGELDGQTFTFTIKDDKLTMVVEAQPVVYNFTSDANTLTLSGGDLPSPVSFARQGDQASQAANENNTGTPVITNATPANDLTGLWSGNGETIEFKADGQCAYLGQMFPYSISPGQVTLTSAQGAVTFLYKVQGDQLSLSYNNNTVMYSRGQGGGTPSPQANPGGGQVAMELVGKWCYVDVNSYNQGASSTSECITLNADGTYTYESESSRSVNTPDYYGGTNNQDSDRGTWYVNGNRIYYNSATKGQGSYQLEKRNHPKNTSDPMIVIDGRAYVSFYNKPPWR